MFAFVSRADNTLVGQVSAEAWDVNAATATATAAKKDFIVES
ncbi:hypothetical protein PC110_g9418 [Phytophthora cactorum]|uniref:Uncharacterized protein n=1 Tax=Phytophthora cactorum TaxID=29920 RepID=A0A329SC85_9STRA|nr:hypothetical protein PC110_g9418 [Phytophthora cactorum]